MLCRLRARRGISEAKTKLGVHCGTAPVRNP
jgi:hypothetical protein